jgi:hypothetical protein
MTPLFKKLNFKNQESIIVLNSPKSFEGELDAVSEFTQIVRDEANVSAIDFIIIFVMSKKQIADYIAGMYPKLAGDVILWLCYPKGTSKKFTCDFNRDTGWEVLRSYDMESVRQVAIDEDWSALRFRKIEYIKNMIRG